jgi:sepiapterin reductase
LGGLATGGGSGELGATLPKQVVVNVSSLAALEPLVSHGLYCVGKTARDMFHSCLATEAETEAEDLGHLQPELKTLNYAPGPMDTDMQRELRSSELVHPSMRASYAAMKEQGTLVDAEASAAKCVGLVFRNRYESGAHIDWYDAAEEGGEEGGNGRRGGGDGDSDISADEERWDA